MTGIALGTWISVHPVTGLQYPLFRLVKFIVGHRSAASSATRLAPIPGSSTGTGGPGTVPGVAVALEEGKSHFVVNFLSS